MIEVVSEFVVNEGLEGQFELAYGPGGAWSKVFAACPGFRGTTVLRDTQNPRRYLIVDLWDNLSEREQWMDEHKTEVSNLDAALSDWTESRIEVGVYRVLTQATVQPRGRARRRRARRTYQI